MGHDEAGDTPFGMVTPEGCGGTQLTDAHHAMETLGLGHTIIQAISSVHETSVFLDECF